MFPTHMLGVQCSARGHSGRRRLGIEPLTLLSPALTPDWFVVFIAAFEVRVLHKKPV